jgi:nucleoside-diphosphate-sugar epimerase
MIFILGGNGFVGSALARVCATQGREHAILTRANYEAHRGQACSLLVNANGNSRKYLPKEQPLLDFDLSVRSVRASLVDFRFDTYIYLSSCDVYPDCSSPGATTEDAVLDVARISPYGFHKLLAEQCVRHAARKHLIFRMGGFVGPGLKKNAVYDILHGGPLWLDPDSELQFLHTDELARTVLRLAGELTNETFNIGGKGTVRLRQVMEMAGRMVPVSPGAARVRYEINLAKIAQYVELTETETAVRAFVQGELRAAANTPLAA